MKLILLIGLAFVPSVLSSHSPLPLIVPPFTFDQQQNIDGEFSYKVETIDGTHIETVGTKGSEGQINMRGSYRFTLPDGTIAEVTFVADENGFQPQSDLLPTAHPLPGHAPKQVRPASERSSVF